jgi:hypothetical protein
MVVKKTVCACCILFCLLLIGSAGIGYCDTIYVKNAAELANAIANANSSGGNKTILLQDGTYTLSSGLWIYAPNVSIGSRSRVGKNVIIQGDAMSSSARVGSIFTVAAANFQIYDVTLQRCGWHTIQIKGENNANSPVIRNCVLRDAYEQLLKVTIDPNNPSVTADNGVVENCLFEYTAGVGPEYYIGGIDAHGSKGWVVRKNIFRYIISPNTSIAEHAIHFWHFSANNTVEKNLIIDCDRGIGFGLDGNPNTGGIIRNNMIYHSANNGQFADVGIYLVESPGTQVYNNTILMQNSYPNSIEYRFSSTTNVLIVNNLTDKPITARDGASGTLGSNVTSALAGWFVNPAAGDLHLASAVPGVAGAGQAVPGLVDDYDGDPRPQPGIDIGADQYSEAKISPPANSHSAHQY